MTSQLLVGAPSGSVGVNQADRYAASRLLRASILALSARACLSSYLNSLKALSDLPYHKLFTDQVEQFCLVNGIVQSVVVA